MHVPEDHTHPKKDVAERKRERGTAHLVRTCHAEVQVLIGPSHRRGQQAKQRSQVNGETWLYISVVIRDFREKDGFLVCLLSKQC